MHTKPNNVTQTSVATIYLGGTFGCAGTPLSPLSNDTFFPLLQHIAEKNWQTSLINVSPNIGTQDSSQATPKQLTQLYTVAKQALTANHKTLLIIQGTDTLSHCAAFFAYACATWDMHIVFLASMQPLLLENTTASTLSCDNVNPSSDAIDNLNCAIQQLRNHQEQSNKTDMHNVWIAVNRNIIPAVNTQKTHRTVVQAFSYERPNLQQNSLQNNTQTSTSHTTDNIAFKLANTVNEEKLSQLRIYTYFCVPQSSECVTTQLSNLLAQKSDALILIGYGAGNFPYNERIQSLLQLAQKQEILVVISSQVPFGSIVQNYASGSWLYENGVLNTGNLSIASCYARLCWLCASTLSFTEKQQAWAAL